MWPNHPLQPAAGVAWRRDALLPGLVARAEAHEAELLAALATTIDGERRCCRFLRFEVAIEPDGGPVWLASPGRQGRASSWKRSSTRDS
ncbi:MAG: hypothetical protein ACREOF_00730 [Gemmatimonadales bacterium]